MPFLIDGHNVIAALPDLSLADPDDEVQLVLRLRRWAVRERRKVAVIFDAGLPGGRSRELSSGPVEVIFASVQSSADAIIRQRLRHLRTPREWTVVSSDRAIQATGRAVGARILSAQEFAAMLAREPAVEVPEKPELPAAAEIGAWLELFPEPPPQAAENPPRAISPPGRASTHESRAPAAGTRSPRTREKAPAAGLGRRGRPRSGRSEPEPADKPLVPNAAEVEAWLAVFKEPSESELLSTGRAGGRAEKPAPASEGGMQKSHRPVKAAAGPGRPVEKARGSENRGSERPESAERGKLEGLSPEELEEWLQIFGRRRGTGKKGPR